MSVLGGFRRNQRRYTFALMCKLILAPPDGCRSRPEVAGPSLILVGVTGSVGPSDLPASAGFLARGLHSGGDSVGVYTQLAPTYVGALETESGQLCIKLWALAVAQ